MSAAAPATPAATGSSYGQIFKSTAFTGGASLINLALGVVRTKVMAVLLGPAGVGLAGIYTTILSLATTVAGMGVNSSGVRQIAEAAGTGNQECIARTDYALRRTSLVLGILGAVGLIALSYLISRLTFGDASHTTAIAALSIAVLFTTVSAGQIAIVQGLRRIGDLARLSVLGALAGTVLGVPLLWFFRERGIVPVLLIVPATMLVCSWWFARQVKVTTVRLPWRETAGEARALLSLGTAFMLAGILTSATSYVTRLFIVRYLGVDAAGHYSAAYTLSGIYSGFILQAMGADFFPRLTAVSDDHPTVNRLVNEQTEIALLMATPGVLGTLVCAPWVIHAFYAGGFDPAAEVLQWQVLGVLGRVLSWPLGFILLAKGRKHAFFWTETISNLVHVASFWVGLRYFGLPGAGMSYAFMYLFYVVLMLAVTRALTGFHWSAVNTRIMAWVIPLVALTFLALQRLPTAWGVTIAILATLLGSWACLLGLAKRIPAHRLGRFAAWLH